MQIHPRAVSTDVNEVLDDLRRIVRVLRASSRDAERRLGVSGAQLFVLRALAGERAVSVNTLAARTRTHQSTVSGVVKRLVERRLVHRALAEQDRRRTELRLTAAGESLLARAPKAGQERLIDGLERMARRARAELAAALHGLVRAMGLADEPPGMFFDEEPAAAKKKTKTKRKKGTRRGSRR
ncbi:MAG TPA: MarR family transcriptional regulator [Polyangia bacterium]|nr:MarR family transcriptional regulator [Polyangia bacterium]